MHCKLSTLKKEDHMGRILMSVFPVDILMYIKPHINERYESEIRVEIFLQDFMGEVGEEKKNLRSDQSAASFYQEFISFGFLRSSSTINFRAFRRRELLDSLKLGPEFFLRLGEKMNSGIFFKHTFHFETSSVQRVA